MDPKTGLPEHIYHVWSNLTRTGDPVEVVASSHDEACRSLGLRLVDCYVEEFVDDDLVNDPVDDHLAGGG
ncbi:MAG: hypothetical protein K2W96_17120 [Gemmataceae bacterium]|nr:hypothetical protein [Gemmataceae bacterium]